MEFRTLKSCSVAMDYVSDDFKNTAVGSNNLSFRCSPALYKMPLPSYPQCKSAPQNLDFFLMQKDFTMASGDEKYRSLLRGDEEKNTKWRFGVPPNYDVVNKLFEEERTNVWPVGSLEERVQSLVKNFEMEIFHKISSSDFKTIDLNKYTFCLNGRKPLTIEEASKLGGYNPFLQTSLPEEYRYYNAAKETAESSHQAFTTTFPRGFALEIIQVYSGPPDIVFKFRHWGYMEGPFKSHAPTEERIEFYGVAIFKVNENDKILGVEFFFDPGELLGKLMKGPHLDGSAEKAVSSCPVLRNTG